MKGIFLILTLLLVGWANCQCLLENCDECDWSTDPVTPTECLTCHGWYEASWQTGLCVLSARLIILCITCGVLLISVTICAVTKYQDYQAKYTERPTNIESIDTPNSSALTQEQLSGLTWKQANEKINDTSKCNICGYNGGSLKLRCGHVFHGDCICWQLRKANKCPACSRTDTQTCTIHCLKCLTNYLECPPQAYVDVKKGKSRVCDWCSKKP